MLGKRSPAPAASDVSAQQEDPELMASPEVKYSSRLRAATLDVDGEAASVPETQHYIQTSVRRSDRSPLPAGMTALPSYPMVLTTGSHVAAGAMPAGAQTARAAAPRNSSASASTAPHLFLRRHGGSQSVSQQESDKEQQDEPSPRQ